MRETCAVCKILDGDTSKKECEYCSFCHAWICKKDLHSPRRIQAWAKLKGVDVAGLKRFLGIG